MIWKTERPWKVTPLMFVRAYHHLPGISERDWIEYYYPSALDRVRRDLKSYLQHQLDLFTGSADYGEYFSVAEYDRLQESISDGEFKVFRSSLRPEDRDTPLNELHPLDTLAGLRAVMLHRVSNGDADDIRAALRLFDYVIECAIEAVDDRNPRSHISLEAASEFVPWFIAMPVSSDPLKVSTKHGSSINTGTS